MNAAKRLLAGLLAGAIGVPTSAMVRRVEHGALLILEWHATNDEGDIVLSEEPEVTTFMRLRNLLLGRFVPEQLL